LTHARLLEEMHALALSLQDEIVGALERVDGGGPFSSDAWERPGGGGGLARVLSEGAVFEKAGVNVSRVHGKLSPSLAAKMPGQGDWFAAVGLSLVIHPLSPMVPTAHANIRLVLHGEKAWFGGGADLTPYYLFDEDATHFHRTFKEACDRHEPGCHRRFKEACDAYFFLRHRGEHRGVGGIFFEDLGGDPSQELAFVEDVGRSFLRAYLPIVERRRTMIWGEPQRTWQEIRRGRYVEFNLLFDRGTVFGLETGGRTESILMSLPPRVRWVYDHRPEPGSAEARLLEVVRHPRDWT
jgi:coproporphyrinogen III oxidase